MSVVAIKELTRYYGQLAAVDHITLDVESGEVFGFIGPNGAGKTTTIRMLCTLLPPTSGTAEILGNDIREQPQKVRESIVMVQIRPII